jgi:Leucine-rich repeat (LRR) protein
MENLSEPRLLQAFFEYAPDFALDSMDDPTKAALRLSCKNAKAFLDGTVTTAAGGAHTVEAVLRCDWRLSKLEIEDDHHLYPMNARLSQIAFTSLLHAVCSKFPMLQVLEIRPSLFDLPANIGQLSKLNTLKIMYAYFTDCPASFGQLSSLERLELYTAASARRWRIECLAPLKQLTQLKHLRLNDYLVSQPSFPAWLGSCHFPVLEDLMLSEGLQSLPSSISNFRSLTALILERSRISVVPETIGSLNLLKKLCLGYTNAAVSLPRSFLRLTALEELEFRADMQSFARVEHANKLTKLSFFCPLNNEAMMPYPEFLWTFTSLQTLLLWGSNVPSLPDALGNLEKLEVLHLESHQNLEEIPESLGISTCLTSFKIRNCPMLLNLPESIGNLEKLRELEIIGCRKVTTLPESLGDLQSLEKLNLTRVNRFERLPSSIGNLHALKVLIINYAGEVILPESFADLVLDKPIEECSLEKVYFFGNTKVMLSGPRSSLALGILEERGVLQYHIDWN